MAIPTHSVDELIRYFSESVDSPVGHLRPTAGATPRSTPSTEVKEARLAAMRWLDPSERLGLGDLVDLQSQVGLAAMDILHFQAQLLRDCTQVLDQHPPLRLWCLKRVALLEFMVLPARGLALDLSDLGIALRRELIRSSQMIGGGKGLSSESASRVCSIALAAGARAVADLFRCGSRCQVSANLMLCGRRWVYPTDGANSLFCKDNGNHALEVWREDSNYDDKLVVVAETTDPRWIGWWVPAPAKGALSELPGPTVAFRRSIGSTVFRDDPPVADGNTNELRQVWSSYLDHYFQRCHDDVLISLPVRAPTVLGSRRAIAVMNVCVAVSEDRGWRRAYHHEWLETAIESSAQFAEIAYWGYLCLTATNPLASFEREGDNPQWDALPSIEG